MLAGADDAITADGGGNADVYCKPRETRGRLDSAISPRQSVEEGEWHGGGEEVVRGEERGGEKKWTAEGKKG